MSTLDGQSLDYSLKDGATLRGLVDPDPERPRISRRIYADPEILGLERERLFGRAWCFVGHESEIPEPGDYVARDLAGEPVVLIRGEDGVVRAFLNSCRHRGMRVCRADRDRVRYMRCPYHGWTYNASGELVHAFAEQLYDSSRLVKSELGLIPVAQLDSFHGMFFATWDPDAAPLGDYLGDMAWYLHTLVGRTADGSEVVGVPQVWQMETNWKFSVDNFTGDPYHLATAHGSIAMLGLMPDDPMAGHEGHAINAGNGHQLLVKPSFDDATRYYALPQEVRDEMARDPDETRRDLMANTFFSVGTVFPNLSWLQIQAQGDPDTPATSFLNTSGSGTRSHRPGRPSGRGSSWTSALRTTSASSPMTRT